MEARGSSGLRFAALLLLGCACRLQALSRDWELLYDSPGHGIDVPAALAVDSQAGIACVAGSSRLTDGSVELVTLAAEAAGRPLWSTRWQEPGTTAVAPVAAVLAPGDGGARLFTVATVRGPGGVATVLTHAQAAADGQLLWQAREARPDGTDVRAVQAVADPVGTRLFVAAVTAPVRGAPEALLLAYDMSSGALLWRASLTGKKGGAGVVAALAWDEHAATPFLAAAWPGAKKGATLAAARFAADGVVAWRFKGKLKTKTPIAVAALVPDLARGRLYVAGDEMAAGTSNRRSVLAALDLTAKGSPLWFSRPFAASPAASVTGLFLEPGGGPCLLHVLASPADGIERPGVSLFTGGGAWQGYMPAPEAGGAAPVLAGALWVPGAGPLLAGTCVADGREQLLLALSDGTVGGRWVTPCRHGPGPSERAFCMAADTAGGLLLAGTRDGDILLSHYSGLLQADADGDGLQDAWEILHFGDLAAAAAGDDDNDLLGNAAEQDAGTDPRRADTDGDGLPDSWEVLLGTLPLVPDAAADPDGDGLTNAEEFRLGRHPGCGAIETEPGTLGLRVLTPLE